jgi:hypothetical protein
LLPALLDALAINSGIGESRSPDPLHFFTFPFLPLLKFWKYKCNDATFGGSNYLTYILNITIWWISLILRATKPLQYNQNFCSIEFIFDSSSCWTLMHPQYYICISCCRGNCAYQAIELINQNPVTAPSSCGRTKTKMLFMAEPM